MRERERERDLARKSESNVVRKVKDVSALLDIKPHNTSHTLIVSVRLRGLVSEV